MTKVDDFYAELGSRIQAARKAAGITQTDLAKAFGLTRSSIANIEAGRQHSPIHVIVEMAGMLGFEIPSLAVAPQVNQLLVRAVQASKRDRNRLNACLEQILQLAHDGRWPRDEAVSA